MDICKQFDHRVVPDLIYSVVTNWKQIKLKHFLNSCSEIKAVIRILKKVADVQCHLEKFLLMLFHISNAPLVISWAGLAEFVRSRVELIANILMRDLRFTDWLIMERADFISVDLWKNLPIGCAKVLPLGLSALRAITKLFGFCTAIVVHIHKESVSSV